MIAEERRRSNVHAGVEKKINVSVGVKMQVVTKLIHARKSPVTNVKAVAVLAVYAAKPRVNQ
ncbi:hypothetical protein [Lysinibacillus fusiformis]|uniref:hypothetical protein n=1 Tax=Lysinibacillus fusiformis TaxID=28031 RepID=UPI00148B384F|nr:hypothetical protein [Lysinibacillus fusiformis]NOG26223.1 hypothetical protein [Lysinibacillus fusiformis]